MKIYKIRIKNYKSIVDSEDCFLSDKTTILAGKNESGKSSILEALDAFNVDKEISSESKRIQDSDSLPLISIEFIVNKEEINPMLENIGAKKIKEKTINIVISKEFPNIYSVDEKTLSSLGINTDTQDQEEIVIIPKDFQSNIVTLKALIEQNAQFFVSTDANSLVFNENDIDNEVQRIVELLEAIKTQTSNISDEALKSRVLTQIETIQSQTDFEVETPEDNLGIFIDKLKELIPNFILFRDFNDVFPNKIPFSELEQNEWVRDLAIISDLNVLKIKNSTDREKKSHKTQINIKLNDDYSKFWTQDLSKLNIDWDSGILQFWIEENDVFYEPNIRSKGKQWHLAFYIRVTARSREGKQNIILIDEPGLFLHAEAQKNILDKLEDCSTNAQVIFSTHSPYLLETDKLNRIRLIYRNDKKGTVVENKVHALSDKETLTPILTAIGAELNSGIVNFEKDINFVVEGPSDYFYLTAFNIFKGTNYNFVYGGGSNMPIIGSILNGWGGKVIYVYDNDQGKTNGELNLINNWFVTDTLITSVIENEGSIEDIFEIDDFKKFVLRKEDTKYTKKNSEYVKNKDKVLKAKLFLEDAQSKSVIFDSLSTKTKENINSLFNKLSKFTTK